MNASFKNKVVLITGASSGIGEALARVFAKEGAALGLLARRLERIQQLASECQQQKVKALAIATDVTKEEDLPRAVEQIHQSLGTIDVVVANAGFGVMGNVEQLTVADFKRQFETNIYGVLRTIYATLDDLKKTKGRLVIIGSVVSHLSTPKYAAYSMSKHAIKSLADTLYFELAPYGISVTLICPGFVKTEIREINNLGEYQKGTRDHLPDWIRLAPEKAAKIIVRSARYRERERIITAHGKFAVFLNRNFPAFLPWFFRLRSKKLN